MRRTRPQHVIGLTGGYGSGKSTALRMFRAEGAAVFDADKAAHRVLARRDVSRRVKRKFGAVVMSGESVDRKKLGGIVFRFRPARRWLERAVHPGVRREMRTFIRASKARVVVCDIPLLFESGWHRRFPTVVVVSAPEGKRMRRLQKSGVAEEEIVRRFAAQWPMKKKISMADIVIDNGKNRAHTLRQIRKLMARLLV